MQVSRLSTTKLAWMTLLAVIALTPFLPAAQSHVIFGGHGFGTQYAQSTYWIAWRMINRIAPAATETSVCVAQAALIGAVYGLIITIATFFLGRSDRRFATLILMAVFSCYVLMMFAWPQARFGP